jgi:hypothetical protein
MVARTQLNNASSRCRCSGAKRKHNETTKGRMDDIDDAARPAVQSINQSAGSAGRQKRFQRTRICVRQRDCTADDSKNTSMEVGVRREARDGENAAAHRITAQHTTAQIRSFHSPSQVDRELLPGPIERAALRSLAHSFIQSVPWRTSSRTKMTDIDSSASAQASTEGGKQQMMRSRRQARRHSERMRGCAAKSTFPAMSKQRSTLQQNKQTHRRRCRGVACENEPDNGTGIASAATAAEVTTQHAAQSSRESSSGESSKRAGGQSKHMSGAVAEAPNSRPARGSKPERNTHRRRTNAASTQQASSQQASTHCVAANPNKGPAHSETKLCFTRKERIQCCRHTKKRDLIGKRRYAGKQDKPAATSSTKDSRRAEQALRKI